MESKKNKLSQEIFATESIWRLMAKMCVPAVLTILIMVLYNMADIYFIGQTGDSYKVTALLCMPITTVLSALGSMVAPAQAPAYPSPWAAATPRVSTPSPAFPSIFRCCWALPTRSSFTSL